MKRYWLTTIIIFATLIAVLFWPASLSRTTNDGQPAFNAYCPRFIGFLPDKAQPSMLKNPFVQLVSPPTFFGCLMKTMDNAGALNDADRQTYGMMFLITEAGPYKPRYDLYAYFLQEISRPDSFVLDTLAYYYESGKGVDINLQKAAHLYRVSLVGHLPQENGKTCQRAFDTVHRDLEKSSPLKEQQIAWFKDICTKESAAIYAIALSYLDKGNPDYSPSLSEGLAFYLTAVRHYRPAEKLYSQAVKEKLEN